MACENVALPCKATRYMTKPRGNPKVVRRSSSASWQSVGSARAEERKRIGKRIQQHAARMGVVGRAHMRRRTFADHALYFAMTSSWRYLSVSRREH